MKFDDCTKKILKDLDAEDADILKPEIVEKKYRFCLHLQPSSLSFTATLIFFVFHYYLTPSLAIFFLTKENRGVVSCKCLQYPQPVIVMVSDAVFPFFSSIRAMLRRRRLRCENLPK